MGEWEPDRVLSTTSFEMEWPPFSGRRQMFPEVDQARFFSIQQARRKIKPAQWPFIERLMGKVADMTPAAPLEPLG